ncbi:guanylate kinase [Ophiostoma piceae UAMH 11346]|uniref:Guanylate kinase n=1 Tax=Ophiostoma piceae (strain UAMH 11346) TaxID=1262450 RepID=S3BY61_OPHP1|nr:guanylate kinase [Ophiostoma piceae UAMH 11346]
MPGVEINSHGIPAVETIGAYLSELLDHAEDVKPSRALEPALSKADFDDIYGHVGRIFAGFDEVGGKKLRQFAIVETAARDIFGQLIATTTIDAPDFVRVWNLFDILTIFSDNMECDAPLVFWLIEELLDSQTIAGCRKVFDYLESRRERITAKYFNSTKLVILRSCNDLLRRLSRADDTPFCGRVFIFLFQVFPLGDKSSVNLRGEYHLENVTTYDDEQTIAVTGEDDGAEKMDVDDAPDSKKPNGSAKKPPIDFSSLYPVFWSLQASFSQPRRLFDPAHFTQFKDGMESSLAAFRQISNQDDSRKARQLDESRRGVKRKRNKEDKEDELADAYNPKYLTSRDLFELEVCTNAFKTSDLTFRRHFLLQALIIMEFLLSLSSKSKGRLAPTSISNKSVAYSEHTLSDEDTAWATKMKNDITDHIKNSNADGPYFLRMVDTILARDKNWVRWKIESCPSIARPAVSAEEFVAAEDGAQRAFGHNRRRSTAAIGSFSLDFLDEEDPEEALDELKKPSRSGLLELTSFEGDIADEDFEIEVAERDSDKSAKQQAEERKASKTWRALRIVRQTHLSIFDKIESDNTIDVVFKPGAGDSDDESVIDEVIEEAGDATNGKAAAGQDKLPADTQPVVLVGPSYESAAALGTLLSDENPGVFGIVGQLTTRPASPGAAATGSKPQYLDRVDSKAFDDIVDSDGFVGFGELSGNMYGTRRNQVEEVMAASKVPLVLMNYERQSVDSAKGNNFSARYIAIKPSSNEALEAIIKATGLDTDDAAIQKAVATGKAVLEKISGEQDVFDKELPVAGRDLAEAAAELKDFIYGKKEDTEDDLKLADVVPNAEDQDDIEVKDAEAAEPAEPAAPSAETTAETPAEEVKDTPPAEAEDAEMVDTEADAAPASKTS